MFLVVGWIFFDYYCMDGSILCCELLWVLYGIVEFLCEYGLWVVNVFYVGDGNMYLLIFFDVNLVGELECVEVLGGRIFELCVVVGGSIIGEYGVGCEKIN